MTYYFAKVMLFMEPEIWQKAGCSYVKLCECARLSLMFGFGNDYIRIMFKSQK